MEHFNFEEPADVFVGGGRFNQKSPMVYRRFASAAEAIRYAIEMQSADKLAATVVEADDVRFGPAEIRKLYDSADYPFSRQAGVVSLPAIHMSTLKEPRRR